MKAIFTRIWIVFDLDPVTLLLLYRFRTHYVP